MSARKMQKGSLCVSRLGRDSVSASMILVFPGKAETVDAVYPNDHRTLGDEYLRAFRAGAG